ncbi:hypothetical protein F3Y22_tig00110258pilonHSYRG00110 [Hibiscus syriacus]|uniref:Agglutinin domain-containing protein n=1 Tax=Hibiscus syriacus TaxID=106335 RepID=A0A6A3B9Z0_HIBSY|nr:uncharacterized protein LOC120115180 [Hibiscus syriacus]KAE8712295.1 hypothetical protein F3Y22_tig00110258pilonHSYRG00110 [Hibiscus syriacus]
MDLGPKIAFPQFIVVQSNDKTDYLSYTRGGDTDGYLRFFEYQVQNPYAKFEVEFSTNDMVHIRSCQNNKYWERTKNLSLTGSTSSQYWITATAGKKEEDQSKESCTLFQVFFISGSPNTVRFKHVQSGCYLCLWSWDNPTYTCSVLANNKNYDSRSADIFTIVDWSSLVILPKYVAFKGDTGKYLALRSIEGHEYLQFITEDIGDPTVACEVRELSDGTIQIRQISNQRWWMRSPNWIWADRIAVLVNIIKECTFSPVKVDDQTIGLINLGNNYFCKRLTTEGKTNCLNAAVNTVTKEARLTVVEAVTTREIYGVRYDLDGARVYDESILSLGEKSSINWSTERTSTLDVQLSYTETRSRSWKTKISLKLGVKSTMEFKIPVIFEGKIELSGEFQSGVEWGNSTTVTTVVEAVHKVTVPPMTEATVTVLATNGKCDVPFTYLQRDTLFNGETVLSEVKGGVFTGANYYNINFVTRNKKLE